MPEAFQFLLRLLDENLLPLTFVAALIDATGIPFPGRLLLVVAGTQAGPLAEVGGVVLCAAAGALLGDHVLFLIGAWSGDRAVAFYCRVTGRRQACHDSLRIRLRRASVPALILGRFTFAVRAVAATMAGVQARLAEGGGDTLAVRRQQLERERDELLKKINQVNPNDEASKGLVNRLFDVELARARAVVRGPDTRADATVERHREQRR